MMTIFYILILIMFIFLFFLCMEFQPKAVLESLTSGVDFGSKLDVVGSFEDYFSKFVLIKSYMGKINQNI